MPRSRESRQPIDIWPGFVDALSTLLLSIIFLLVVFVLGQFFLGQMLQGKNRTVGQLQEQMQGLRQKLQLEEGDTAALRSTLARTDDDLAAAARQRDALLSRLGLAERDREQLGLKVATLTDDELKLQRALDAASSGREQSVAKLEDVQKVLAETQKTVGADRRTIELQVGQLMALRRDLDDLQAQKAQALAEAKAAGLQLTRTDQQLQSLNASLGLKTQEIDQQNAKIADLGSQLNAALASRVKELSQYRSDFFGRLRQTLGNRDDVRIVGDRFVFQSEVLFDSGAAQINPTGQAQLAKLATTLRDIEKEIPPELPWVLQVDGHTDTRPINTPHSPRTGSSPPRAPSPSSSSSPLRASRPIAWPRAASPSSSPWRRPRPRRPSARTVASRSNSQPDR